MTQLGFILNLLIFKPFSLGILDQKAKTKKPNRTF